jgi:carbamoyltransferase
MRGGSFRFDDGAPGLQPNKRIGPRHPRLAAAGFHFAQWLARLTMGRAGFHQLGSDFARERLARVQEKLCRGGTVLLAGLGLPGTHNSGVALVEVTQANGPRLIVNNEEERFSGNKHTTEYPKASVDGMVATLGGMGREVGDIDAWLTSWDYPTLAGTMARSLVEEIPQSLKLLRLKDASAFDGRRLDQMTRTPKILARQLGLSEPVPLICMPHHDNHAWFSFAASPFADDDAPVAIAVPTAPAISARSRSICRARRDAVLYCNDSMFDSLGMFYSVISSTQAAGPGSPARAATWAPPRGATWTAQPIRITRGCATCCISGRKAKSKSTARWPTGTANRPRIPTRWR